MSNIELINISKEYNNGKVVTHALKQVDLSITSGEFVAIMGTSGSGKTTLLNILGCMDKPTRGKYYFNGMDLSKLKEKQLSSIRGKKIAFIFQHFALIEEYTVYENVEIPLLKHKISKQERKKRVLTSLQEIGISSLLTKKISHLSGGQKQRVAIARALACQADIILADEPTGALDKKTGIEIMDLLVRLNENGRTVIVITHDNIIASFAKRLITIEDGRIVQDEKIKNNN